MSGSSSRLLPPETLRALTRRSDAQGALRLAIHLALLAGAGALVWRAQGWAIVPAMVLLGIVQVTLFAPLHETMHLTAFASASTRWSAGWCRARRCSTGISMRHCTGTITASPRIPRATPSSPPPPPADLPGYLARVSGFNFWRGRIEAIAEAWRGDLARYPFIPERAHGSRPACAG
jgi:hypothetical protein